MSRRKHIFNPLENEAMQRIPPSPRLGLGLQGFRVLDNERVWEEEQIIDGKNVKVKMIVQSLVLDRASDQGALEPGDAGDNYDSEMPTSYEYDSSPKKPGNSYVFRRTR